MVDAASKAWDVPASDITVSNNVISHKSSGQKMTFADIAPLASMQPVPDPETLSFKDPASYTLIGHNVSRKDRGKATGQAIFTQDIQLEGMLTAVIARPKVFGSSVKSLDAAQAKASAGVVDVVLLPVGVAVIAKDFWSAKTGRDKLVIEWEMEGALTKSTPELFDDFKSLAKQPGATAAARGDLSKVLAEGANTVEADYELPYLSHAPMEPLNCVALFKGTSAELWYGSQSQTFDQFAAAQVFGLKPEQITIHTLLAGGSFGRRANKASDYVVEASMVAKSQPGVPVKVVWTREDDIQAGYFRPMQYQKIKGAVENGKLVGWDHTLVGQSILIGTPFESFLVKDGIDLTSVEGAANLPYQIPNFHVDLHTVDLPVPTLWWRSVGHSFNGFTTETFIDELAEKAGRDPVEFRAEMLTEHPRHLGVLKLAAEKAGWGSPLPKGKGRGVAVHESFNSFVAEVAEVTVKEDGSFTVDKIVCAVDCGVPINPDIIRAQMEGGIGYGLSAALTSAITIEKGAVKQSNFHDYQVLRLNQMPEVDVHIVPSTLPPTGVGEPGVPPVAPAVANAIANATGVRIRSLPIGNKVNLPA